MPLLDIRIDERTWSQGTPERRREWRAAITDLLEEQKLAVEEALRLEVTLAADFAVELAALREAGDAFARLLLPASALEPHFDEYYRICKDMGKLREGPQSPRLEALDIAKRLAHDEAAETLVGLCRPLAPDLSTCRRLFTLLVTLRFDTTRLLLPHHLH